MNTIRLVMLMLMFATTLSHAAAAKKVAIFSGDTDSASAVAAITELRLEDRFDALDMRVFTTQNFSAADRAYLRAADLIIANSHERVTLLSVADELRAAVAAKHEVYAVGSIFDPDIAELGLKFDKALNEFFSAGGHANLVQMLRAALTRKLLPGLSFNAPVPVPDTGYYDIETRRFFIGYDDYVATYTKERPERLQRPWVGLLFNRGSATSGQTAVLEAIARSLEKRELNVLPGFGYPADRDVPVLYLDIQGHARIQVLIAVGMKLGNVPDKLTPVLNQLNVPILNAISLYSLSRADWEASPTGLDFAERSWQLGGSELAGAIAPTVVATKEQQYHADTHSTYTTYLPVPERVERLTERAARLLRLQLTPNADKRVALIYYNYPPGRDNIGASYLNVLPGSLWQILQRLRSEGYSTGDAPNSPTQLLNTLRDYGSNPTSPALVNQLVASSQAQLLAVADYRRWFDALPSSLRHAMIAKWGEPETSQVMTWRNPQGELFFVFPAHRWGNLLFAAQPSRGWDTDVATMYHDVTLPPHHQYLAFYLWLQHRYDAHATVHVGTHGTLEWLSGKEVGFTEADPGEVMVGAVPQLYPYIVDNIGEGQQAKRRGMAAIISHLTPPLDKASLNPELRALSSLVNDYHVARDKGSIALDDMLRDIIERCRKLGVLTDLSITLKPGELLDKEQLEAIEDHLTEIAETYAPFGLHTFGVVPDAAARAATADAILSLQPELADAAREQRKTELMQRIEDSAQAELAALIAGLNGRFIAPGPGNDPMRTPGSLPTGKNFYGFDPSRMPTPATYAAGRRLAENFLAAYRQKHGELPERITFNLWATEANRHEGTLEAEILYLMGVKPKWDLRGRVEGVELISHEQLGRARIDVTIVPSGLYRDLFAQLMLLLDESVSLVKQAETTGNPLLKHIAAVRMLLEKRGVPADEAERMASVRLFTEPPGAYGTGLENVINADQTWNTEQDVAAVYFRRVGHLFGQGYWGASPKQGEVMLAEDVFKAALSGSKAVIHSNSSNVYGVLDNDDVYQYLGGTALAIRQIDGKTPEVMIADLRDPRGGKTVTLERFMGQELRARYLNPRWIDAMLKEGYSGARFIKHVTDYLWGWQVTVPEAVDDAKWQEMYETYVADRYHLRVRERFKDSGNIEAYKNMVERMLVAIDKGYWQAAPATVAALRSAQARAARDVAAEMNTVARAVAKSAADTRQPASPTANKSSAQGKPANAAPKSQTIQGREVKEVTLTQKQKVALSIGSLLVLALGMFTLFGSGWWWQGRGHKAQ